ncbi:MAG: hypothetical protein JXA51_01015 [Dehalococcoidales bacterium]|nr:hypothetical protein [Dehalococcoidales bacterium]
MNVLKGLGTAILSLLLFLCLSVFSIAFLLQSTVLNPDFVVKQVDRIDVSEIADEFAGDLFSEDLPGEAQFLRAAVFDIIDDQEPWLKEQFRYVINTFYDYLLSETDTLEITIDLAAVREGLKESIWESLTEQAADWLPDVVTHELSPYVEEHYDEYVQLIPDEYVPPGIADLPEEQLMGFLDLYLQDIGQEIEQQDLVPEITGLLEVLLKPYYDDYADEFLEIVPSEIEWNEDNIPADVMDQLLTAREYIGYFQAGFYWLIFIMVVLAGLIFLVNWNVRNACRALGIDLIVFGALDLIGVIIARVNSPLGMISDVPATFESWLTALYNDVLSIMMWFSIGVLIIGIALLVVSIVVKPKSAEPAYDG